jgi:hypothetical protein
MIRKLCSLIFVLAFAVVICGCAEKDVKVHQQKETQTETHPQPVSPGEPIVE